MSPILMKFGAEVSFRKRTRKQVSFLICQSLVATETCYLKKRLPPKSEWYFFVYIVHYSLIREYNWYLINTNYSLGPKTRGNSMSPIFMKFGADVSFRVRTRIQVSFAHINFWLPWKRLIWFWPFVYNLYKKNSLIFTVFTRKYILLYLRNNQNHVCFNMNYL